LLVKLQEHLKIKNNLARLHKGKVVLTDAAETQKLGRIKVRIRGILEETDTDKLPWVYPQNPYGLGGKSDSSSFSVPEIDSEVVIRFPFDDIYAPFYIGYWQSDLTHQYLLFDTNYPESYGHVDSQLQWWRVNKSTNETEFFNEQLESLFKLETDGSLSINVKTDLNLNIDGNLNLNVGGKYIVVSDDTIHIKTKSGDDIWLESGGDVNLKGTKISLDGSGNVEINSGASVQVEATTSIDFESALINENSGVVSFSPPTPPVITDFNTQIAAIATLVTNLKTLAGQIRSYTDSIADDIGGF
jgi:hypothetical protein